MKKSTRETRERRESENKPSVKQTKNKTQTCLEPSRALLIHLGARCNAVDGHEEQLARTHHCKNAINVLEDALDHLVLVGRVVLRGIETGARESAHKIDE